MNNKKTVLYVLLTVIGLILGYNYFVAPLLARSNTGMGMHGRMMYASTSYFIDVRVVLLIAIAIAIFLLFEFLKPQTKSNICSKCRTEIESERWKICPICGNSLEVRKG